MTKPLHSIDDSNPSLENNTQTYGNKESSRPSLDYEKKQNSPSFNQLLNSNRSATSDPGIAAETSSIQGLLVGEITDTHHPDLPGYVYVQWLNTEGLSLQRWLAVVNGLRPLKGDRVLIQQPENWPEKIVTACLPSAAVTSDLESVNRNTDDASSASCNLSLEHQQTLQISDANGAPLIEVSGTNQGPMIRLLGDNITIEAPNKLRFRAQTLELEGGRGGITIATESDTVVRGRHIRLN